MRRERSQQNAGIRVTVGNQPLKAGVLFLVAVPIGDWDDLTLRAIQILRDADLIASEDPATTRRLLSHHGIDTRLTSYGPANLEEKVAVLIDRLQQGALDCNKALGSHWYRIADLRSLPTQARSLWRPPTRTAFE